VSGSFPQPCAVRQAQTVIDRAYTLDTYQQNVNINIGDGTYTTAININQPLVGGGIFFITGNTVTPSNVLLNVTGPAAFVATEGARVFVTGIKFQSTGDCIQANYHSKIILFSDGTHEGYEVGACGGAGIQLSYYSAVQSNGNYRISGGGGQFIHVTNQSIYTSDVSTATIVGTPAYSNFFMGCSESSTAVFNTTWSGSATGSRAFIHQGCIVGTTGSVAVSPDAYFPGNAASNWFGDGSFNDLAARLGFTPIAVPGTPPTGTASVYADSTTKRLCNKDDAGVVSCTAVGVETAWTAYTPTITAGSGTFTSVSATGAFKQIGKTVYFRVSITITTNNTAAGRVEATLPVAANSAQGIQTLSGVNPGTPVVLTAFISPAVSTTKMLLFSAGGTYPGGDGVPLAAAGVYEVP
jgi:hypothetical protein